MKKTDSKLKMELDALFLSGLNHAGIRCENSYLVGVSGGMDSVFLAHFLQQSQVNFSIAHLNHAARETAERDQEFVQLLAGQLGVAFSTETVDVPGFAKREGLSFEEAARIVRYRFLMKTALDQGCDGVIVGHHADDQVETVLMHLLRGSGIAGLSGMKYNEVLSQFSATIPILRPMLGIWREDIERYCHENGLLYVEDETNADDTIYRNRLRHHLLPVLESYNPGVRQHLWQTSMISRQTLATLDSIKRQTWDAVLIEEIDGAILLNLPEFLTQENGVQQILIRHALEQLLPDLRDFGYELTMKTIESIQNPPEGAQWQVVGDIDIFIHSEKIYIGLRQAISETIKNDLPQWDQDECCVISNEQGTYLLGSWEMSVEEIQKDRVDGRPWLSSDPSEAWLNKDKIHPPLVLRSFREGDRFTPFGLAGKTKKISDYFIDNKIPNPARKQYPLICDQEGVLWVVGERIADRGKVTRSTETLLHLQLSKKLPD